ncbi:MAG TPA: GNAT family N-acetyltransferase [Verrucomicrobiae bacterium]|nr:GNAT family N-acetyltransferase [Verrucomicrobiae bacterium]
MKSNKQPDDFIFTLATDSDAHLLAGLLTDAMHYKVEHGDETWGSEDYSDKEAAELIALCPIYLVKSGAEALGTVALQTEDKSWTERPGDALYLHRIAVAASARGQNLGKRIIDWALAQTAESGRQFLRLDCDSRNAGLCAYYEKQGFNQVGTKQSTRNPNYLAALFEQSTP